MRCRTIIRTQKGTIILTTTQYVYINIYIYIYTHIHMYVCMCVCMYFGYSNTSEDSNPREACLSESLRQATREHAKAGFGQKGFQGDTNKHICTIVIIVVLIIISVVITSVRTRIPMLLLFLLLSYIIVIVITRRDTY